MMESNFYSDDFERLIREKTEQYKMYPSEKVWKGVYSSLHTKKRWFIGGMSLLVTGIIVIAGRELILPSAHPGLLKKQPLTASLNTPKVTPENTVLPAPFAEFRGGGHSAFAHNVHLPGPLTDASFTMEGTTGIVAVDPVTAGGLQADPAAAIGQNPDRTTASDIAVTHSSARGDASGAGFGRTGNRAAGSNSIGARPSESYASYLTRVRTGNGLAFGGDPFEAPVIFAISGAAAGYIPAPGLQISLHPAIANRSMTRVYATELLQPINPDEEDDQLTASDTTTNTTMQKINWLQDYALYSMHPSPRKNKAYWQIYAAPTENTRMLSGATPPNAKLGLPGAPAVHTSSPNTKFFDNFMQNIGFEAGGSILYKLSRTVSVKGGLQFNYSRYSFSPSPVAFAASLAPIPNSGNLPDSSAGLAGPPSPKSQRSPLLHNEYFQLSAPIGLELRVWGNDRLQVNIAATVQPAYLLNANAWLRVTEGMDYVKAPSLYRKWNVDGGAEAYISYKIGGLHIQAGPEIRYQFLSSYNNAYPLRENLASYGLKFGILKAIR